MAETRTCAVCGSPFTVFPSMPTACCSLACGSIYKRKPRVTKPCEVCGAPIEGTARYLARRRFCSRRCGSPTVGREQSTKVGRPCPGCDGLIVDYPNALAKRRYCSIPCARRHQSKRFTTGPVVQAHGYVTVGRRYVHRMVAEEMLGRPLRTDEHVHHINGNKTDNRPENLMVLSAAEHARLSRPARRSL